MKTKIESIQSLRGIGFLFVFLSHTNIDFFKRLGHQGVSIFFVLSGFVLTYSCYNRKVDFCCLSSIKWSIKKIFKLYPLHIVTMLAMLVIQMISAVDIGDYKQIAINVVMNIFLLQSWSPVRDIYFSLNAVSWYLSATAFMYLMFPILYRVILKRKIKRPWIGIIMCIVMQSIIGIGSLYINIGDLWSVEINRWAVYICPLVRMLDFVIGCLGALIYFDIIDSDDERVSSINYSALEISVFALLIIIQIICNVVAIKYWWTYTIIYIVPSLGVIILMATKKGCLTNMFDNLLLRKLGETSGACFLIHCPVLALVRLLVDENQYMYGIDNKIIIAGIGFALTIVTAFFWNRVESKVKVVLKSHG